MQQHVRSVVDELRRLGRVPWIVRSARILGGIFSLALVTYVLVGAVSELHSTSIDVRRALLALTPAAVAWVFLALGWASISPYPSHRGSVAIWSRSQVLRYLPGFVWAQASRAATVRGSVGGKVTAIVAEGAATLAAVLALGGGLYAIGHDGLWLLGMGTPVALVVLCRAMGDRLGIPFARVMAGLGCYFVSWTAYAVAAVLAQSAVGGGASWWTIAGGACLAWSIGYLSFLSPGGVGVRELAYVAFLASQLTERSADAGALILRCCSIVAELGLLIVVVCGGRWVHREAARLARAPRQTPAEVALQPASIASVQPADATEGDFVRSALDLTASPTGARTDHLRSEDRDTA